MSKTDDIIKLELSNIGNYKNLKRRGFVGSSNHDQELWDDGGLTFKYGGHVYGSNDFAWYKDEKWTDPGTGKTVNFKPVLVIEGTHCLNTKSYGTAQIQRFHHAYGPFRNGIISIYYLRKGKYQIRHDLLLSAYYANIVHDYKKNKCAYLVTEDIKDIEKLVHLIGDYGEESDKVFEYIDVVLKKMKKGFDDFLGKHKKLKKFEDYLNERAIFKFGGNKWIKFLGTKKESFLDSSIRQGHIVLGEAMVAHYLLLGSKSISPDDKYYFYFPLITKDGLKHVKDTLTHDKEFILLSNLDYWTLLTYDDVEFDDTTIKSKTLPFRNLNLNDCRKEWNIVRDLISAALKKNKFKIY